MHRLILKRFIMLIPVLIGVTFLVFSILSLAPGDPVLVVLGDNATEEAAEAMRHDLGLDSPPQIMTALFTHERKGESE